ncbi:uncharacterized protein N7482_005380 [Penicillium canariense]|uniref:Uncharacterized protein n=1 Tax=Penicillium canariense TaxID=189055 RepID=A0A9W9LM76_9EURO|nr:uncharacterized protein N7482_005380 [Penicillium canariense]KAJ5166599.1 hypothetical protein N7482_005380 [Penicillium canariense]
MAYRRDPGHTLGHAARGYLRAREILERLQGMQRYASTDTRLNSSLTIEFNRSTASTSKSGLNITRFISNGTNVLNSNIFGGRASRLLPIIVK